MNSEQIDLVNQFINRSPFNRWLGMACTEVTEAQITLTIKWREDLISSPESRSTHGGVLAALIDCAADYAIAIKVGHPVMTMDMRVDYHRIAKPGNLLAKGNIVNMGNRFATAEAQIFSEDNKLIATGRALYLIRIPGPLSSGELQGG